MMPFHTSILHFHLNDLRDFILQNIDFVILIPEDHLHIPNHLKPLNRIKKKQTYMYSFSWCHCMYTSNFVFPSELIFGFLDAKDRLLIYQQKEDQLPIHNSCKTTELIIWQNLMLLDIFNFALPFQLLFGVPDWKHGLSHLW